MIAPAVGYRVEGVAEGPSSVIKSPTEADGLLNGVFNLELDNDMRYYQDNYISKPHFSFVTGDSPQGPVSVSIVAVNDVYKTVIRTAGGNVRTTTPKANVKPSFLRQLFRVAPSAQDVLRSVAPNLPPLKQIVAPGLPNAILTLEEKQTIRGFKFGILYAAEGQTKEDEMFSNINSSPEFEEFLDFFGRQSSPTRMAQF